MLTNAFGVGVKSKIIPLTDDLIKAMPTTAVQVVPAPGAGKMLVAIACCLTLSIPTAGYTNLDVASAIHLAYGDFLEDAMNPINTGLLVGTGTKIGGFIPRETYLGDNDDGDVPNQPLKMLISNAEAGNLTGGDVSTTGKITVLYAIVRI